MKIIYCGIKTIVLFFILFYGAQCFSAAKPHQPFFQRLIHKTYTLFKITNKQLLQERETMPFTLIKLPFAMDALEPYISEETLKYHYGKHHQGYVNKLNSLLKGTKSANETLENLIKNESGGIFNNAAQIWNHNFYWLSLTPKSSKKPAGKLLKAIDKDFGSFDKFKEAFKEKALSNFGSGWTWLVKNPDGALEILNTSNADTPMRHNKKALLTCDVWEHAYYIDYRNERGTYIDKFWNIVNWQFVEKNYEEATGSSLDKRH